MKAQSTKLALAIPTWPEMLLVWLQRLVAVYCLLFGVLYWLRLIGLNDGAVWRFDTMPYYWRGVSVALAVFFPFAGIGLWSLASWGPVIWLFCAITESVMYLGFPYLFGAHLEFVIVHASIAACYLLLRGLIWRQKRTPA